MRSAITFLLFGLGAVFCNSASPQNPVFLRSGKILFEKRVNMYSYLETGANGVIDQYISQYKRDNPQFAVSQFHLSFKDNVSMYKRALESKERGNTLFWKYFDADNIVYSDLGKRQRVTQKNVFEEKFLLFDSIPATKWKITDETREIAGFQCRRANALILDSVFVVAFYTTAITYPGGPEGACGLPGMILGLAIPSKHVTWFATKVYLQPDEEILPPSSGKKVNRKELGETLLPVLKGKTKNWKEVREFIEF